MPLDTETSERRARLADPALRAAVLTAVRRRLRGNDADDVVQATFADVLCAVEVPSDLAAWQQLK